jgi:hypothetical protein
MTIIAQDNSDSKLFAAAARLSSEQDDPAAAFLLSLGLSISVGCCSFDRLVGLPGFYSFLALSGG